MKKLLLLTAIIFQLLFVNAQKFEWLRTTTQGNQFSDPHYSPVGTDPLGNIYTMHHCDASGIAIQGDTFSCATSHGNLLAKYSPSGTLIWGKMFTNCATEKMKLTVDDAGAVYFSFDAFGSHSTDDTTFSTGGPGIVKVDSSGNFIRYQEYGGISSPPVISMLGTDLYLASLTNGLPTIQKLDSAFNVIWAVTDSTNLAQFSATGGGDMSTDIFVQENGELVCTFQESGNNSTGPGIFGNGTIPFTIGGQDESGIVKMDTSGNVLWAYTIPFWLPIDAAALDHQGNVYITFSPAGGTSFIFAGDTLENPVTNGTMVCLLKWNSSGMEEWGRGLYDLNGGRQYVSDLGINSLSEIIIASTGGAFTFHGDTALGHIGTGPLYRMLFVLKVDNTGNFKWYKTETSTINMSLWSGEIAVTPNDEYVITGASDGNWGAGPYHFACFSYSQPVPATEMDYITLISEQPECNPQGINEGNSNVNFVIIYPNPAYDYLQFSMLSTALKSEVAIYNLIGNKIMQQTIYNTNNGYRGSIDISLLPAGIYILKITNETGQQVRKFVKE